MAAYNGEQYIKEQIDSVLGQTCGDFTLWISDDASTDGTWDILNYYAGKYPEKIKISRREVNSGSAKHNFFGMMTAVRDDYVMLCDQDDVWLPHKIEKTLFKMKETEQVYPGVPVLIRTDMKIVGQDLQLISPSYKESMHSNFSRTALRQVLIQNTFAGCTAMYNRALANLLYKEPSYCIMHDWWLELTAAAFGKISHVDEPTILYRQHGGNEIGAKDVRRFSYKINRLINNSEIKEAIRVTYKQAESFLDCYGERLTHDQADILRKYCSIPKKHKLSRLCTILELGSYKNGIARNIAYFIFV